MRKRADERPSERVIDGRVRLTSSRASRRMRGSMDGVNVCELPFEFVLLRVH